MEFFNDNQKDVTTFAAEALKWELPFALTQSDLDKIKVIANSAITHTHDVLNINLEKMVKQKFSIEDIARFNRLKENR